MNGNQALWRTLIVDDEPLAREGIRARLVTLGGFDVVDECGSGRDAIVAIRSRQPDLVFLDVQMPIVDGFAVVSAIGADAMPATVFVTAYDHYALRAFDAQVAHVARLAERPTSALAQEMAGDRDAWLAAMSAASDALDRGDLAAAMECLVRAAAEHPADLESRGLVSQLAPHLDATPAAV